MDSHNMPLPDQLERVLREANQHLVLKLLRMQEEADESDQHLGRSPVAVYAQDVDLRYTWAHQPIRGMPPEDLLGKRDVDVMERLADAEEIGRISRHVLETGMGARRDVVVRWKDVDKHYDFAVEPLRDARGRVAGITCAAVDITERKAVERAAREREERVQRDLALARSVQRDLVSMSESPPSLKVYSSIESAYSVGGDFYDLTSLRGGRQHVTCTIGDVVGKGVAASLVMVLALTTIRNLARTHRSPASLLRRVNTRIRRHCHLQDPALTAAAVTIDLPGRALRYARAGHEYPLVWRKRDRSVHRLESHGRMLGVFDDATCEEGVMQVDRGDKLILYTDGITEASSDTGARFGNQALEHLIAARGNLSVGKLGALIRHKVKRFRGSLPAADDVALVVVEIG